MDNPQPPVPRPANSEIEDADLESVKIVDLELPTSKVVTGSGKSKKSLASKIAVVVLTIVLIGGGGFEVIRHTQKQPDAQAGQNMTSTKAAEVKIIKVTYDSTDVPSTQNSQDGAPILANGSYLELNGGGEVNYNGVVVATSSRARDAVLSKNGKHYAYRLETGTASQDGSPVASDLYIDGHKVATLGPANLLAVSNDGLSYITKDYTSTKTPTSYNSGIAGEVIKLNDSKTIVSSPYGFMNGWYAGDVKNILTVSRNYDAGATWYYNDQKLANCVGDNSQSLSAILSSDGNSTLCSTYAVDQTANNAIKDLTIFVNDTSVFHDSNTLSAGTIAAQAVVNKGQWMVLLDDGTVYQPGGAKPMSSILPEADAATQESACSAQFAGTQLAYVTKDQLALLVPCSSKKLFTKGINLPSIPLSTEKVTDMQYSSQDNTFYLYEQQPRA